MKYDYGIVGCGLFGSVFAREMTDKGAKCLVIDKRSHIGGNCYTKNVDGINVHLYGAHIFHTNNKKIWDYVNRFADFNNFINKPKVKHGNEIFSFPINLMTMYQLWGVMTPQEAKDKIEQVRCNIENPSNLEEWILTQVGGEIYEKFIYEYTKKQWGRDPKDLPSSIIKRLPIRFTFDENYFNDKYQGIPIGGYTNLINNLLKDIPVELEVDYLINRNKYDSLCNKIVYTGALDEYFEYDMGELEWRSLRFEHQRLENPDFQGNAVINYTKENIPYTRIIEHAHFEVGDHNHTIITKEYPQKWGRNKDNFYPINTKQNNDLQKKYKKRMVNVITGGRLADYAYYDMDCVIGIALKTIKSLLTI